MVQPSKELTLVDTVVQKVLMEGVNDIEDVFAVLPLPRFFAKGLEREIYSDEAVQFKLAVTTTASLVKEYSEGTIWRRRFKRFDVRYLRIYSTSL